MESKYYDLVNDIKQEARRRKYTLEKILLNTEENFEKSIMAIDESENINKELYSVTKSAYYRLKSRSEFHTFKIFDINKLITLHEYLEDEIPKVAFEKREWFEEQRKLIFKILFDNPQKDYYVKNGFLHRKTVYKTNRSSAGRLYAQSASAQYLSKEIRYFLLDKEYYDFDIVNSQYSSLYAIARHFKIEVPYIQQYVQNRELVLEEKMIRDKINKNEAKKRIIATANASKSYAHKLGYFCNLIYEDVVRVRENAILVLYNTSKNIWKEANLIPKIAELRKTDKDKFGISLQSMKTSH